MKYLIDEGHIVDTAIAKEYWVEATDFHGSNAISRPTGDQWTHETLYQSRAGNYYIEHTSQWQGSQPSATWADEETAARWLLMCDLDLPDDLKPLYDQIVE